MLTESIANCNIETAGNPHKFCCCLCSLCTAEWLHSTLLFPTPFWPQTIYPSFSSFQKQSRRQGLSSKISLFALLCSIEGVHLHTACLQPWYLNCSASLSFLSIFQDLCTRRDSSYMFSGIEPAGKKMMLWWQILPPVLGKRWLRGYYGLRKAFYQVRCPSNILMLSMVLV